MSRLLVASIAIASLSTVVGCGSSSGAVRQSTIPSYVAERDDSRWMSPEERECAIVEAQNARTAVSHESPVSQLRPNTQTRPTRGAVHAATY